MTQSFPKDLSLMIEATIHEGVDGSGRGTFSFLVLPSPGDRLVVGNNRGSCDVLVVEYVEHHPVKVPSGEYARKNPYVTICAVYHSSVGE